MSNNTINLSETDNNLPVLAGDFRKIRIQNTTTTGFIHENTHQVTATEINFTADNATHQVNPGGNFNVITENGLLKLESTLGKIQMLSNNPDSDAILIKNNNTSAGITFNAGNNGIIMNSSGNVEISSENKNITIGGDNTIDINVDANETINVNGNDVNIITTDDILFKSTSGEIALDTGISTDGVKTLVATASGDVLINSNTTNSNFQTEIHVNEENIPLSGRNGLLVVSNDSNVTPEVRISYTSSDGSRQVINTMGTYSETSTVAQFRKYIAIRYDNKLVAIEGLDFDEKDIGRKIVSRQSGKSTTITGITNIIFPVDNTYLNSNITVSGTYTGTIQKNYKIEIDGVLDLNKPSDTFRWSNDAGNTWSNTFIPLYEALEPLKYTLEDGITLSIDNISGNQLGDFASFITRIGVTVKDSIIVPGTTEQEKITNALTSTEVYITTNPFNAFFGTVTNNDVIFKTADQERFRITADGSFGASKDKIDARLHLSSDINSVKQVNDNLITTGANIKGNQINPTSTELNTGGYIVVYESQEANGTYYDIYADYFTANGEKVSNGISFKANKNILYDQSHPHVAKSGNLESDNYIIVWSSQDPDTIPGQDSVYQIRGAIIKNGTTFVNEQNDLFISSTTTNIAITPRVCGLSNGKYVIVYSSLEDNTNDSIDNPLYTVKYVITDSNGNIDKIETSVTDINDGLNKIYPFICSINSDDSNNKYAGGFVIAYMKEVFSADNRYKIVYKIFTADGSESTPEHEITTTGDRGEVGQLNTDFNLSDGRCSLYPLPRNQAINGGGFLVAYQTNFSSSVEFITNPTRTITGLSSGANGDIFSSTIDPITGVHVIVLNSVNGTFLESELLSGISDIQGDSGFFLEKIDTVLQIGSVATITLSKDPRNIVLARYSTTDIDNNTPNNLIYRKEMNTTNLVNDRLFSQLVNNQPLDFIRANSIFYAYRGMPVISINGNNGIICWQSGEEPNIYYQQFNINNGSFIEIEGIISKKTIGYRQTDPYINKLFTTQGGELGYSLVFSGSSLDQSSNGIFQELLGTNSYLFHINNETAEFVLDNNSRLGIGLKDPLAAIHVKSIPNINPRFVDQVSMIMQTSSNDINNSDDLHKISFQNGDGTELARIKVKYTNGYQDMNPDADNLISYFKLDEDIGSLIAVDSGLYNLQVDNNSDIIASSLGSSALLYGFDTNKCWIPGLVNNGLLFDGNKSHMLIPRDAENNAYVNTIDELYSGNFTISYWVKIEVNIFAGTVMDLLSFGDVDLDDNTETSGFMKLSLVDNNNDSHLRPRFAGLYDINSSGVLTLNNLQITTSNKINDGEWHNIIFHHTKTEPTPSTFKSRIVIYQDGIEIGNSDSIFENNNYLLGGEDIVRNLSVYIGSGVSGSKNYYRGMLDELRFYRSALSTVEIARIYKYGSSTRTQVQIQTLGNNNTFSDTEPGLVIDDTGAIVGGRFKNNIARQLSGIIKISVTSSNMVNGVYNTKFISEIQPGDNLYLDKTPNGDDLGSEFAGNFYQVEEIISDTLLRLNRPINSLVSDIYFNYVTIRPSILLAYDDNEIIKLNIDFNGDVVIGNGKTSSDITKLEIRGDSTNRTQKNGLTLSNTNVNVSDFYLEGARGNHILYKAQSDINTSVVMGSLEVCHSNTNIEDNKSVFNIKLNNGNGTNLDSLQTVANFTGSGKINFVNNISESQMLNDIQFNGKINNGTRENLKIAFLANDSANGIFSESTHLNFFGGYSVNTNNNDNDNSALVKIRASNDNPNIGIENIQTALNGRIDFMVNKQLTSDIAGLRSRMCITSRGFNGVHIINPDVPMDIAPEFNEDNNILNPITEVDNINKKITFTDNDPATAPMFSSNDENFLRCGRLVVNDGSNLNSYIISSGITETIFDGNSKLVLNTNSELLDSMFIGKEYDIHYPGLKVNKYGQVGIGDSRFNDTTTCHHLSISGNTCVKGELHITSNIDVTSCNDMTKTGFKVNENGELLMKDSTTGGYIKIIGGPLISNINKISSTTLLTYDNTTVLINNTINEQIQITIPSTNSSFSGYTFNIKKISNVGTVKIICEDSATIDGFNEQFLLNQYSALTIQTDGEAWYVITSHLVPDDIAGILS